MDENLFIDPELTSAKLSDLTKIPTKDFEKQFREWMDRDDVARSLQAKLRYDLISNFNKTILGRHIISQTTMTTCGAYGSGKQAQRLTLSPLILALNTLVAEFLYAENCHFSLSMFCTEVPFHNTLPNFEQSGPFRFTTNEIQEILQAIIGNVQVTHDLKLQIIQKYTQSSTHPSLLLLLLQTFVELVLKKNTTETKYVQVQYREKPISSTQATMTNTTRTATKYKTRGFKQRHNPKNMLSANFRKLNRYLAAISQKITENVQQLGQQVIKPKETIMTKKSNGLPTCLKSNLIKVAQQLRQMSNSNNYNRQFTNLQNAIMVLGKQFENCANNLILASKDVEKSTIKSADKATNTILRESDEKLYAEWVRELRESRNGQKLLDRIENSLRKALNNQKLDLQTEANANLETQKAVLKIHYRQKLLDHLSRESQMEIKSSRYHGDLEEQLQALQIQYSKLLQRIEDNEKIANLNARTQETLDKTFKHLEISNSTQQPQYSQQQQLPTESHFYHLPAQKASKPKRKKIYNKYLEEKQVRHQAENIPLPEKKGVNNLVFEAKLRLLELDQESNQLENSLSNCLERQRRENKFPSTDSLNVWEQYTAERHRALDLKSTKCAATNSAVVNLIQKEMEDFVIDELREEEILKEAKIAQLHARNNSQSLDLIEKKNIDNIDVDVNNKKFTNPIALAKKKFFKNDRLKSRMTTSMTAIEPVEELRFSESSQTLNFRIASDRITEHSVFLEHDNHLNPSSRQQKDSDEPLERKNEQIEETELETSSGPYEELKNETVIILQKSTEKLNKLFSSSRENLPKSLDGNDNDQIMNDRTFTKKMS